MMKKFGPPDRKRNGVILRVKNYALQFWRLCNKVIPARVTTAAALASLSGDVRLHSLRSESDILSGPGRECQDCQGGWRSSGRVADKRRRVAEFREGGGG